MKNPFDFSAQVAVVTGGSGVLGGAIGQALAECGATVVLVAGSRMAQAEARAAHIRENGGQATAAQADVLSRSSLQALADVVMQKYGRVDMLINAAGGARKEATTGPGQSFFDLPEDAVRFVVDLNFLGTFLACQVFGQIMVRQGGGRILNFSSMGALRPLTRSVAYSAGKAAISNFTRWLGVHLAQEYSAAIRVNALVPGFFLTEQNRFLLIDEKDGDLTARGRRIIDHTPMGRFGQPEDIIGPALWLLSDAAGFVHCAMIVVDGGIEAYGGV